MEQRKEINWINVMKAICIFVVFINHSEMYCGMNSDAFNYIYQPVFVNSFFFINGYLFFGKQLDMKMVSLSTSEWNHAQGGARVQLLNILNKLVLPTILFSALFFLPKTVLRGQSFYVTNFLNDTIGGASIWFTPALAVAQLLFLLALSLRKKSIYFYIAVSVLFWCIAEYLRALNVELFGSSTMPCHYKSGMTAMIFMSLGGLYKETERRVDFIVGKYKVIWIIGLIIYIGIRFNLHSGFRYTLDVNGMNIQGFLIAMLGIAVLKGICTYIPNLPLIHFVGRHSIGFYFFSGSVVNVIAIVAQRLFLIEHYFQVLAVAAISFIVAGIAVYFLDRYIPFVYDFSRLKKIK